MFHNFFFIPNGLKVLLLDAFLQKHHDFTTTVKLRIYCIQITHKASFKNSDLHSFDNPQNVLLQLKEYQVIIITVKNIVARPHICHRRTDGINYLSIIELRDVRHGNMFTNEAAKCLIIIPHAHRCSDSIVSHVFNTCDWLVWSLYCWFNLQESARKATKRKKPLGHTGLLKKKKSAWENDKLTTLLVFWTVHRYKYNVTI